MEKPTYTAKTISLTPRSVLIALLLIPLNSYWMLYLSYVWDSNRPDSISLLFNVVFVLLLAQVFNLFIRRFQPKFSFTQAELLTIYAMLCQASVFAGRDMLQVLVPLMGNGFWYATLENEWAALFHRYLPAWLTVGDRAVLRGFYEGQSSLYANDHLNSWVIPVLSWCAFILVLSSVFFFLNILMRRQWTEHEKLTYPIAQLPFEVTRQEKNAFFKGRRLWLGALIAALNNTIYSLHQLYPALPWIPMFKEIPFAEKPWDAMSPPGFRFSFFPFAIGLGYLMPLDLAFSCWFFHLFWHLERIIGSLAGWRSLGFPKESAQLRGVWVGLFLFALWIGRPHLKTVIRAVINPKIFDEDRHEALRYRTALIGCLVGLALIVTFCIKLGMSLWVAALFFGLYFAMSLTVARVRAELGPPSHDFYNSGPDVILASAFGTRRLGAQNLSGITLFFWINHLAYRAHPMPHQLEALKLAKQSGINPRQLGFAMLAAATLGALAAAWGHLHISYHIGLEQGRSWYARAAYSRLASWLYYPTSISVGDMLFSAGGLVFTIGLLVLRMRFLWFPLHPVGYVVSSWWTFTGLWFPILISWSVKRLLLQYGGVKSYRKALPLFLGFIVGDVIAASLFSIAGIFFNFRVVYLSW